MCKGATCASFNLSGKTEDSIDLFIKFDMCFETAGFDNFKILDDIPSFPVAFLMPILLICFSTNSLFSVLLLIIVFILGWLLSIFTSLEPMSLATFMKKLLKVSGTLVWIFIISSFSHRIMSFEKCAPKV